MRENSSSNTSTTAKNAQQSPTRAQKAEKLSSLNDSNTNEGARKLMKNSSNNESLLLNSLCSSSTCASFQSDILLLDLDIAEVSNFGER